MSAVKKETQGINNKETYFYIIKSKKYMDVLYNAGKKECPILIQEIKVATAGQIYKPEKHPLLEQEPNVFLEMNTAQPVLPILTITASATATDHVEVVRSASLLNLSSALREDNFSEISQQSMPNNSFIETASEVKTTPTEKTPPILLNKSFLRVPMYSPCRKQLNNETECVQEISPINSTVAVATAAHSANRSDTPQAGPSHMTTNYSVAVAAAAAADTDSDTSPQAGPSKSVDIKCPECNRIFTCCHNHGRNKKENNKSTVSVLFHIDKPVRMDKSCAVLQDSKKLLRILQNGTGLINLYPPDQSN
ncbi:hypothetical protein PUN28_010473 [Cardiocondyla obscurior]|uniref:Uncharacterized protein n=1 Tax=Cardiocondyla obscurior TaxID=286306 RepID=A0AAW2FIQ6_9HYME